MRQPMDGWNTRSWKKVERGGCTLQKRRDRAPWRGEARLVRALQRLVRQSWSARLVATRRVTQENQGKKTAGVDGRTSRTPAQRLAVVNTLRLHQKTHPVRRVWRPKPATDAPRPCGIPTSCDRALQAWVNRALEPPGDARVAPHSSGWRPGRAPWEALGAIEVCSNHQPQGVLEAARATGFDRMDHDAWLRKIPANPPVRRQSNAWLKAGVVEHGERWPTDEGTPQGGARAP